MIFKYNQGAKKEKAENPDDLPPWEVWRPFIDDFRTFCLSAPEISAICFSWAEAGLEP
jgi:hypothetical protein